MMGALRHKPARPFNNEIDVHDAKYFESTFVTLRASEFNFLINSFRLPE
jgi:hypothetical protein